jgi:hypothetical protein
MLGNHSATFGNTYMTSMDNSTMYRKGRQPLKI